MGEIVEQLGEAIASDVLHEAIDEVRGRSSRKWGVALVVLFLGAVIALVVVRSRSQQPAPQSETERDSQPLPPPSVARSNGT